MANNVTVDPRYLSFDTPDVERILKSVEIIDTTPTEESPNPVSSGSVAAALAQVNTALVECATKTEVSTALEDYSTTEQIAEELAGKQDAMDEASEESVRNIVKNWSPDQEPEPEPGE